MRQSPLMIHVGLSLAQVSDAAALREISELVVSISGARRRHEQLSRSWVLPGLLI